MLRRLALLFAVLAVAGAGLAAYAFLEARRDPVLRTATLALPDWPADTPPLRVALLSDLHLGDATTDPARLARTVALVNRASPDLVVIAGDFLHGHDPAAVDAHALTGPLSGLRARFGVVAVLGNHDWWLGPAPIRRALAAARVTVVENGAVVRGPLAIGGLGDDYTHHDRLPQTLAAMRRLPGARLILAHTPDAMPRLPADVSLLLAGHTHCGQIVFPLIGAPVSVSRWGNRYRCGIVREGRHTVVVGAGIGTSGPPLRLGAPPDLWLLTLGPRRR